MKFFFKNLKPWPPELCTYTVIAEFFICNWILHTLYYPGQKKNHPEIRGEKNTVRSCDIMLDHERSAQGKVIRDSLRLLLCADRAWYHAWNSVLLAPNHGDGFFFVQGSTSGWACGSWHHQKIMHIYKWMWHRPGCTEVRGRKRTKKMFSSKRKLVFFQEIVLLYTMFRPGNWGLLRVYIQASWTDPFYLGMLPCAGVAMHCPKWFYLFTKSSAITVQFSVFRNSDLE